MKRIPALVMTILSESFLIPRILLIHCGESG